MDTFLSFLTVETEVPKEDWLGKDSGWTRRIGDNDLLIGGGRVREVELVEYLDSIQYGENLDNPYNNYVTPFHLFDIMTDEGKSFFLDYYADEINSILDSARAKAKDAIRERDDVECFWESIRKG